MLGAVQARRGSGAYSVWCVGNGRNAENCGTAGALCR